jgi:sortase B
MFGTLKNVLKESWYSNPDNLIIHLITNEGEIGYKIFSAYKIKKESYYITPDMNDKEYNEFINTLEKRSLHNYNSGVTSSSNIITLSTCTTTDNERFVVHAYQL